jgi:type VI protein secretion system component Hcp
VAIDVYLQIDGIKGESRDDRHKDWIEVTAFIGGSTSRPALRRRRAAVTLLSASR